MALVGSALAADASKPNIILILADDLGYRDLAYYGHPYAKTPALDRLATEGTRFTQAYAAGQTCMPSRTGIMTGHSVARFAKRPDDFDFVDIITVTGLLNKNGYTTGHFGILVWIAVTGSMVLIKMILVEGLSGIRLKEEIPRFLRRQLSL